MTQARTNFLPELLSPAGSPEALAAAIEGGADAVYFGSVKFSARMRAKNFDTNEITDAIALCRAYGVRSYITVNTRVRDTEMDEVMDTVAHLYEAGADALIVADLGVASLVRRRFPDIELHASTQLSGCSSADAVQLAKLGFTRMVCPRELSLRQISLLCSQSPLEIEMFIHGAHCVSYSGQCMLSYAMGGRSGNRGECAQPCRLPYKICGTACNPSEYPLSLKDMCLASHIREVMLSGVTSLKIEGRQKSADYVYGVTKMYRTLLDEKRDATKDDVAALAALFSRDGFSDGYFSEKYTSMLGVRRSDDTEMSRNAPPFPGLEKKIPLHAELTVKTGMPASLSVRAGDKSATVTGNVPDAARTASLDEAAAKKNIGKLGGTPYVLDSFTADIDAGLFFTPASLNDLRRRALAELNAPPRRTVCTITAVEKEKRTMPQKVRFTAQFLSTDQIPSEAEEFFDEIYLPPECYARDYSMDMVPYAPDITTTQLAARLAVTSPKSVLAHTPSQIAMAKELGIPAFASMRLNVWNTECARAICEMGADLVTVSPELPLGAMRAIRENKAMIAYGRLPLMLMMRCAISDGGEHCRTKGNGGFTDFIEKNFICRSALTDRTGASFPLLGMYDCSNVLYNSVPLYMADRLDTLYSSGVSTLHFIFSTENKADVRNVIHAYKNGLPPADPSAVRRIK